MFRRSFAAVASLVAGLVLFGAAPLAQAQVPQYGANVTH